MDLIADQHFFYTDVFLEPGTRYENCRFIGCRLIWYEGFEDNPVTLMRGEMRDCHIMSFSEYLKMVNRIDGPVAEAPHVGLDVGKIDLRPKVPWHIGRGKRWA